MNKVRTFWQFLNGKKTLIGSVIFFLAMQLQGNGLVDNSVLAQLDHYTQVLSSLFTILGITHKAIKFLDVTPVAPVQ